MTVRFTTTAHSTLHGWLLFSIVCAGVSGLLSLLVAAARIPAVGWMLPSANMFYVAMVGHVSFGLIIWLLAFVAAMTAYFAMREGAGFNARRAQIGLAVATLGAGIVLGSVLSGRGETQLTDYVPVQDTPLYFIGFAIFAMGALGALVQYLPAALAKRATLSVPAFGMLAAVVCALIAALALLAAIAALTLRGITNYQSLFWGVGHGLQYVYVTTMAVAWYALARAAIGDLPVQTGWARAAFLLAPLLALPAPLAYFAFDASYWGNLRVPGIALDIGLSVPTFLHLLILGFAMWQARRGFSFRNALKTPEGAALFLSIGLFFAGVALEPRAALGTTQVPAHYHGMVVGGVSTALMGMSYFFLKQMNWRVVREKIARVQLYVFGVGILLSITGLAWAGTLGAPRKTFDAGAGTAYTGAMNYYGIGAGVAAVGGVIFVVALLVALWQSKRAPRIVPVATRQ